MINQYSFRIIDSSAQELWDLDEVKTYLRISHNYDNGIIRNLINTAISAAENFTNLTLITKSIEFCTNIYHRSIFQLRYIPCAKIEQIIVKKKSYEGELDITLAENVDFIIQNQEFLYLNSSLKRGCDMHMRYYAGFDKDSLPIAIKHGILLHIAQMYDREEFGQVSLNTEIKNLYLPYRKFNI